MFWNSWKEFHNRLSMGLIQKEEWVGELSVASPEREEPPLWGRSLASFSIPCHLGITASLSALKVISL